MSILSRLFPAVRKDTVTPANIPASPVAGFGLFPFLIREPYAGAWQQNVATSPECVLAYHAVFACVTLICSDIAKLQQRLMSKAENGTWAETNRPAYSPVLRKPNRFQNHIQFKANWLMSKLNRGNAFILKGRDARGVVTALYVLDPDRVTPLVADDGSIYYRLNGDNLTGIKREGVVVPASEIIHDRMNCLFHPLVGVSPIFACGMSAAQGLEIQRDSVNFFKNSAQPSGVLTAPGSISDETAKRLKEHFEDGYKGRNSGRIAVLGDDLKFSPLRMSAVDAQLIDQLKLTADQVCSTYHVPAYKVGVGTMPTYDNIEALDQMYYSQCLQVLIEEYELCMDEGLGLHTSSAPDTLGVELNLDGLLRMDQGALMEFLGNGTKNGIMAPNEARLRLNMAPVTGGETPYLQQQNYSLSALARRDAAAPAPDDGPVQDMGGEAAAALAAAAKGIAA